MKLQFFLSLKTLAFLACLSPFAVHGLSLSDYGAVPPLAKPTGDQSAANQKLDFQADLFTGRFNYRVPVEVPPARQGSEPAIALQYNSANQNGWCGVGWDLDMGYIQRETRYGVPVSGSSYTDYFTYSFAGQSGRLVHASDGTYRPEINTAFLKFVYANNIWVVTDKSGRQYTFGGASNSRLATTYGTFKWGLNQITDANTNTTTLTYQTADSSLHFYPYQISYNANGSLSANCVVTFTLASSSRSDIPNSCLSGVEIDTTRLLQNITVTCNGSRVRRYGLSYTTSPSTARSLLYSVTEFGTDDGTNWPARTFSYSQQTQSFLTPTTWAITPQKNNDDTGKSPGSPFTELIDINGDGRPDWVTGAGPQSSSPSTTDRFKVQINNGSGFNSAQDWMPLSNEGNNSSWNWNSLSGGDPVSLLPVSFLIDINGDGLPDRVMRQISPTGGNTYYDHFQVQTNNGTGFGYWQSWDGVGYWGNLFAGIYLTYPFLTTSDGEASLDLLADMNGDGFADRVMIGSANGRLDVQLNNRNGGFSSVMTWGNVQGTAGLYPYAPRHRSVVNSGYSYVYSELMDMNGDGLPDRMVQNGIQLNNGISGFGSVLNWYNGYPGMVNVTQGAYTVQFMDMNGDGLPDIVISNGNGTYTVYFNTGRGFNSTAITWSGVNTDGNGTTGWSDLQSWDSAGTKVMFIDMNGDGLPDRVKRNYNSGQTSLMVQLNAGPFPDLLTEIHNGTGGFISMTYQPASSWDNSDGTRSRLAMPLYTVTSVHVDDGIRAGNTLTYSYSGGLYDTTWREFRGFAQVSETDALGRETITYFYQGGGLDNNAHGEWEDSRLKAGMPYDVITLGSDNDLYRETLNQVALIQMDANGVYFPFVTNVFTADNESGASTRFTLKQYRHDPANGNLLLESNLGEVSGVDYYGNFSDVDDQAVYTAYTYASLSNPDIIDRPATITVSSDAAGNNVLRHTACQYFGATGNLQQKSELICSSASATTSFTYDNYGNVKTITDPEGLVTTINYDATATFLAQKYTGSLTNGFQYDPRSGSLLNATNEQGIVTANAYDGLLRLTNSAMSTAPNGSPTLWRKRFQYNLGGLYWNGSTLGTYNYVRQLQNDPAADSGYHETYTYLDGLGRGIQVRDLSETNNQYRVTDVYYNPRGDVMAQTYPLMQGDSGYSMPSSSRSCVYTAFDPIGRVWDVFPCATASFSYGALADYPTPSSGDSGSPVGPLSLDYGDGDNPWAVRVTDARSKVHKYLLDAFGRTNQIIEVTSAGNATTTLAYNPVGDLTNITDSAGNSIAMFYDLSGHQVAVADPDMGFWQYGYDLNGRLKSQLDAKNQQTLFYYDDAAGRLTKREGYTSTGQCVSTNLWTYDASGGDGSCTVFPGQVYKITDDQGWQKFSYDARNRTLKSFRYLAKNGSTYTNLFAFDDADRLTASVYPNGGPTITNLFDAGGHLSQVKQFGGSNTVFYTAKGFNALNQLNGVNFGNGVATTYGYYSVSKRLQQITTAKSSSIQNLTYRYDSVGNISNVTDAVYSGAASATIGLIQYDDLNRLTTLTNANGTFAYGYNAIGNLLTNKESGTGNYVYGTIRPHCVRTANGVNYTYDLNGNMALRGKQRLFYDVNNRLNFVWSTNGVTTTFGYSADGARLWEQSGSNALQVWIGGNYEEKDGQILFHIYADGRLVTTFDITGTNVFQYYHPDNLTSTSIQSDKNGNQIQNYLYSAFGQSRYTQSTNLFKVSRRYTGQVLDEGTGLYYYNARYYDPNLGRFTQPDDIIPDLANPQSYNRYAYCVNNPLRFTDPSGHDYLGDVGGMFMGYYDAGAGLVTGTAMMLVHPINTVQGIGTAVAHPINTGKAIASGVAADWNSGARGQGKVVGDVLLAALTAAAPSAQAGNLSKVSEIANAGEKASSLLPVKYNSQFAAEQILNGSAKTPGGRTITPHAAGRMVNPPPGRSPMSASQIDQVLDEGDKIRKVDMLHPNGPTVTIQNTKMPGKPQVVVDAETGNRVVTVIQPKN